MKLSLVAATLGLAAASSATFLPQLCLTQHQAEKIVNRFIGILNHKGSDLGSANATAHALIADDYQEISDSILSLEGAPLGGVSANKQQFIQGILNAPPDSNITTYEILPAGCSKIIWAWKFESIGSGVDEIKGFDLFSINQKGQICQANIEFNSIAWGTDTHQLPPQCYASAVNATA